MIFKLYKSVFFQVHQKMQNGIQLYKKHKKTKKKYYVIFNNWNVTTFDVSNLDHRFPCQ